MMLYENIRFHRTAAKISQEELARRVGYTDRSSIAKIEAGRVDLSRSKIESIAKALGVGVGELLGVDSAMPEPKIAGEYAVFPVIGEIAAGYDNYAVEQVLGETVEIPVSFLAGRPQSDYFVLAVKGDSMYPDFKSGDRVLILKQPTLEYSGQIGAVIYDDDIATLKCVEFAAGEDWLRLRPINPNVPPIDIRGERLEHCKVLGVPKLLLRQFD